MSSFIRIVVVGLASLTLGAVAFDASARAASDPLSEALDVDGAAGPHFVIPARTSVTLRVLEAITTRSAKPGDLFKIELVNDILNGASVAIPAGTQGVAEVVHSSPKGFGGRAGELIVAARYLDLGQHRLRLRATRLNASGSDNSAAAIATAAIIPLGGFFVTGTSVDLPVGRVFVAQTADNLNCLPAAKGGCVTNLEQGN